MDSTFYTCVCVCVCMVIPRKSLCFLDSKWWWGSKITTKKYFSFSTTIVRLQIQSSTVNFPLKKVFTHAHSYYHYFSSFSFHDIYSLYVDQNEDFFHFILWKKKLFLLFTYEEDITCKFSLRTYYTYEKLYLRWVFREIKNYF